MPILTITPLISDPKKTDSAKIPHIFLPFIKISFGNLKLDYIPYSAKTSDAILAENHVNSFKCSMFFGFRTIEI